MNKLYYGLLEEYNPNIHGKNTTRSKLNLKDKCICLNTKNKAETIIHYEKDFEAYLLECKERNKDARQPFFTLLSIYKLGDYTLAVDKVSLIIKIQKMWRKYKTHLRKKYNVRTLFHRQQFSNHLSHNKK